MNIGIDIMGGDFAPDATLEGVKLALNAWAGQFHITLFGQENLLNAFVNDHKELAANLSLVPCEEVILMGSSPVRALQEKQDSSIAVGLNYLSEGKIDAFCSAGNTGAMLVGAVLKTGVVRDDLRPCLLSTLPRIHGGKDGVMLDVGAIADTKAENLVDLAVLGSVYAREILKISNPKIGLLSIGEEPEKGNAITIAGHKLLAECRDINFIGNIEGRDVFTDKADVVVTSGFTGNVVVKLAETFYEFAKEAGLNSHPFFDRLNYEIYGGSPILGVNRPVVVGHGISSPTAIQHMIRLSWDIARNGLPEQIKQSLAHA